MTRWSLLRQVPCLTRLRLGRISMPDERLITYSAALNEALRDEMRQDSLPYL